MSDEHLPTLTATLTWTETGATPVVSQISPQPSTEVDLDRFWDEVALPAILAGPAPLTDPNNQGTMEWAYTSGGRPVTVVRTARPAPTSEEDFDRFWTNVMKPAILASYVDFPPD